MDFKAIIFRVDAGVNIGMGHARRCFNIALELLKRYSGEIYFFAESLPVSFQEELRSYEIKTIIKENEDQTELEFLTYAVKNKKPCALIIDSFQPVFYQEDFQKKIIYEVNKLAYIAFDNKSHYYAHILHNQNPLSLKLNYKTEPYTQCLFGLKYLILDNKIRQAAKKNLIKKGQHDKLVSLITFGGSDPKNLTLKVLRSLSLIKYKFEKFIVVLGSMYPFEKSLMEFTSTADMKIDLYKNTQNMHELMGASDIAFVSGGTTTWELGAMGIPMIILPSGKKECSSAEYLNQSGWAQFLKQPLEIDSHLLAKRISLLLDEDYKLMAKRLRKQINIDGVENFVHALFNDLTDN